MIRDLYLVDLAPRCEPSYLRQSTARINRMLRHIRVPRVRDLETHMLLKYRSDRIAGGTGNSTVNGEIKLFKAMMNWADASGLIAENPVRKIKRLPVTKHHIRRSRRALSDDEIRRLLDAARESDEALQRYRSASATIEHGTKGAAWNARPRPERIRQYPLWFTFVETGGRYSEVVRVVWGDINFERRELGFRHANTKNGKQREVPLFDVLVRELLDLREQHRRVLGRPPRADERVFLKPLGKQWEAQSKLLLRSLWSLMQRAKIERVDSHGDRIDIHALRHTCATRMARKGVPITHVQRILGHSSIELTARFYTHLGIEDLRAAIERVHTT